MGVLFLGLVTGSLATVTVGYRSPQAAESTCRHQMAQIGLGLLSYKSAYGEFPPPYTVDEDGNRLHSWRVLILPFIEERPLYDEINLSEPWDSPANQLLSERMPFVFRCPFDSDTVGGFSTNYIIIEGDETAWDSGNSSIKDGASQTILFVESVEKRQHWMSPYNVTFDEVTPIAADGRTGVFWSGHEVTNGIHACFCDGSVRVLASQTSSKSLRAMLTASAGDK